MNRAVGFMIAAVVGLAALESARPALVAIVQALWPLVLVVGVLVIVARLVWFFTNRW